MKRGDLVSVLAGDYGKLRPAVVVLADEFALLNSFTVLPITTDLAHAPDFRISLTPSSENGLLLPSQVMVDKASTVPRRKAGYVFGHLSGDDIASIDRALLFLGLA